MDSCLGLDFGTTNTVLAQALPEGRASSVRFHHDNQESSTFRSVLCFWKDESLTQTPLKIEAGPWAIDHFLEHAGHCRFLQSLKSYAASAAFQETRLYGRRYTFEDLLETFLLLMRQHAGPAMENVPKRLVVGRPVRFAGASPDERLALSRYREAFRRIGVDDIRFVYEPVAAAFYFAQRLTRHATVLVADFGGGTSDFSIMRFELTEQQLRSQALASSGVAVAGDTFDFHIIDNLITPKLGKGTTYLISMGKELELPHRFFSSFARWNELSVMKNSRDFRDLKELQRYSSAPDLLQMFIDLIELDLGYALYKAVSDAKMRLSAQNETPFVFESEAVVIRDTLRRSDFNMWIADDLHRIEEAVDDALRQAEVAVEGIDKVFLTGGSSFVPAVRQMLAKRFGAEKIETGDELTSIAHGLALIGRREDLAQWCAPE